MAVEVLITDEAKKEIEEIKNVVITTRLFELVERLKNWPEVSGVKKLSGNLAGKYRMRTGDYRLQFRVETKREKVEVEKRAKKTAKTVKEIKHYRIVIEKAGHRDGFYDD